MKTKQNTINDNKTFGINMFSCSSFEKHMNSLCFVIISCCLLCFHYVFKCFLMFFSCFHQKFKAPSHAHTERLRKTKKKHEKHGNIWKTKQNIENDNETQGIHMFFKGAT